MDNKTNGKTKDSTPSIVKIELVRICANRNCEECKSLKHFYHNMVSRTNQHTIPYLIKQSIKKQPNHNPHIPIEQTMNSMNLMNFMYFMNQLNHLNQLDPRENQADLRKVTVYERKL